MLTSPRTSRKLRDVTTETRLITAEEAADRLGMTRNALDVLRHRGGGPPYIKVGLRAVRYDPADIDRWITAQKITPKGIAR